MRSPLYFYNSFDVVSMLLMILLFIILRGKQKANLVLHRLFNYLVVVTFFTAAANIIHSELLIMTDVVGTMVSSVVYMLYVALLLLLELMFTFYVLGLAGVSISEEMGWRHVCIMPFIVTAIGLIANHVTRGGVYSIIRDYIFFMDAKSFLIILNSLYYVAVWFVALVHYRKAIDDSKRVYIRAFIVIHLFCLMLYFLAEFSGVFTFELSIILVVLIFAIQRPDDVFDKTDAMFLSELNNSVKQDILRDKKSTLLFIRLHANDVIYDSFGELNADKLVAQLVAYLNGVHRSSSVYRVDRNTIAVKLIAMDEISIHAIKSNILDRCKKAFKFGDISTVFSVGVAQAMIPEDAKSFEDYQELIRFIKNTNIPIAADVMYHSLLVNDKEADIIEAVKKAVENNGFKVFYQPIYSTKKKKIVAAEALIRLFDDKLGFISPEIFIPLAEREGYILKIGEFVFTEVCRFYSENKLNEMGIDYIEVNLSAVQCMQYKLADEFIAIMHKYGLNSSQINFEITESSAMNKNSAVELNINYFVDHGVDLSLDDYGTGYSNISYLYNLPFAFMKIDKSILWSSDKNDRANITLNNIFKMAKNLKMRTVVEGVETEDHITKLLELGCDYFQGYYFSKPVNENEFIKYIDNFTVPAVCMI